MFSAAVFLASPLTSAMRAHRRYFPDLLRGIGTIPDSVGLSYGEPCLETDPRFLIDKM